MASSTALRKKKSEKFSQNVTKRGLIEPKKKTSGSQVGPWVIGFFVFVVVGSAVFQIIQSIRNAP